MVPWLCYLYDIIEIRIIMYRIKIKSAAGLLSLTAAAGFPYSTYIIAGFLALFPSFPI